MEIIKKNISLLIVVGISLIACLSLFNPGFFPIHDDEQVGRLFELNYALESGHFPPRISQNLGFGYGYPFFNFYPSFVYYFAQIFVILGFSYIVSIKLMIVFGFIFASLFMYLFAKEYFGKIGGIVAATLYTFAPYHSVDVYVRGALPEFWSFVFIPAIFWSLVRLSRKVNSPNIVIFGIFCGLLVITHNLVALMSLPFFGIFFLYLVYLSKNKKDFFLSVLLGGVIGILLTAYFWIPAILENKFTMVNLLTTQLANYNLHFVSLSQFIHSPWGYGGSILGPNDGLSLEIGKIHLMLFAVALIFFAYKSIKAKNNRGLFTVFVFMFLISVFMQSYYSKFVWDAIAPLSYIQFPWRFMLFSVFAASFITGFLFLVIKNLLHQRIIAIVIVLITILFYFPLFSPSEFLTNARDEDYISLDVIRWKTSKMAFEYVPAGIATKKSDLNTTIVDIEESEVAKETVIPLTQNIKINNVWDKPHYKKFEVKAEEDGEVRINTFSFPGWEVFINGNKMSYNDNNKLKLIIVNVPKGEYVIEAKFQDTPVRRVGNLLSLLGIGLVVVLLSRKYLFKNEKAK